MFRLAFGGQVTLPLAFDSTARRRSRTWRRCSCASMPDWRTGASTRTPVSPSREAGAKIQDGLPRSEVGFTTIRACRGGAMARQLQAATELRAIAPVRRTAAVRRAGAEEGCALMTAVARQSSFHRDKPGWRGRSDAALEEEKVPGTNGTAVPFGHVPRSSDRRVGRTRRFLSGIFAVFLSSFVRSCGPPSSR